MIVSDERVERFVAENLTSGLCPPFTCIGLERNGEIVSAAIFNCYEGADVHIGIVGKVWTRAFIVAIGQYVFDQLGCERMTGITQDPKVVDYGLRLGGKVEGVLRSHFGKNIDATIIGILRNDWLQSPINRSKEMS